MLRSSRKAPAATYVAVLIVLLASAAILAQWEEAHDLVTLDFLTPFVMTAANGGALLTPRVRQLATLGAGVVLLFTIAARNRLAAGVTLFAILAQVSFLWGSLLSGIVFGLLALACAVQSRTDERLKQEPVAFQWRDFWVLLLITAPAFILRLYALNRVSAEFEGELSPYYLGATTLGGIVAANAGEAGPWSPLGLLFYVPIHVATQFFGATVLAIRFSTAAVSLLTLPLLYYFALMTFGRVTAVLAATFFALDPLQIGWGRTDVHPHGVTTWPVILIALATSRAFTTGEFRYFVATAVLMGLVWHQYPSGQLAVLIPLIVAGLTIFRGTLVANAPRKFLVLGIGVVAWTLGGVLAGGPGGLPQYVAQLGPRVGWNETVEGRSQSPILDAGAKVARHTRDLAAGVFVELPYRFHQDVLVDIPELPTRSTPWIVAALVLAAACVVVTRPLGVRDYVVIAWVVAAALPAVFSDRAYPKRAATLFPVLFVIAGVAGARYLSALAGSTRIPRAAVAALAVTAVTGWFAATASLWFSGVRLPYGKPGEVELVERLTPHLTPGTLVVADMWHGYQIGKLSYLLHDTLTAPERQPLFWYVVPPEQDVTPLIAEPTRALSSSNPEAFYYRWSSIGEIRDAALGRREWRQAIFLLQSGLDDQERLQVIRPGFPFARSDSERVELLLQRQPSCAIERFASNNCTDCGFIIARCPLQP